MPSYDRILNDNEIRLLHLSPSTSEESPIHLNLEAFPKDECPEYEAVSYT